MVIAAAKELNKRVADSCNVNADDQWALEGDVFISDADAMLEAAGAPELLEIVRITIGNVRSLGPAGALAQVYTPYREWLAQLEAAYTNATGAQA